MKYKTYELEDQLAREDYISSRTNILKKLDAVALWTDVIRKAINDITYFSVQATKRRLKKEEEEYKQTAIDFLFNKEHTIPFDHYTITIECPACKYITEMQMTDYSSGIEMCGNCSQIYDTEEVPYSISKVTKEISFKDLSHIIWGINDMEYIRNGIKQYIKKEIENRLCKKK